MDAKLKQKLDASALIPNADWLTHDEMIEALQRLYPGTQHGKDYTVGMMLCPDRGHQTTSALIVKWNLPDPEPTPEALHAQVKPHAATARTAVKARYARAERDHLLKESDGHATRAMEEGDTAKQRNVTAYRQNLRDLPLQIGFPHNIVWPKAPF
ncbi:tail fiber assembly protein [Paraburkholderia oxyphila]|uniref:tail fiber assembly protein n=1 Tax=Paraburkholderia oxyphila TaxID=614212 RepID=UPI0005BBB85B|nr:tail fiber assembly protein [Paraburkholderia oxyphila]